MGAVDHSHYYKHEKREQILNRKNMKIIVATSISTDQEISQFFTVKEAAEHFNVGQNVISKQLQGRTKASRKLPDVKFTHQEREVVL